MKKLFVSLFCIFMVLSPTQLTGCCGLDSGIQQYDVLAEKDERCSQAWADVEVNLQRRNDLIPNLVATVEAASKQENETLKAVVEARAKATQTVLKPTDLDNPEKMKAFNAAQGELSQALSRLMVANEKYPELKSQQGYHDLRVSLEGTENRIQRSREVYNKHVSEFNSELRKVRGTVLNKVTGQPFRTKEYYQADAAAHNAPKVTFTPSSSSSK